MAGRSTDHVGPYRPLAFSLNEMEGPEERSDID